MRTDPVYLCEVEGRVYSGFIEELADALASLVTDGVMPEGMPTIYTVVVRDGGLAVEPVKDFDEWGDLEPEVVHVPDEFFAELEATPSRDAASFDVIWDD